MFRSLTQTADLQYKAFPGKLEETIYSGPTLLFPNSEFFDLYRKCEVHNLFIKTDENKENQKSVVPHFSTIEPDFLIDWNYFFQVQRFVPRAIIAKLRELITIASDVIVNSASRDYKRE